MSTPPVEVVVAAGAELGEGPVWDADRQRLVWIDIAARAIHCTEPDSGDTTTVVTPSMVGAVAPWYAGDDGGRMVAALTDGFWSVDGDVFEPLALLDHDPTDLRLNDGKCDPAGRFWAGSMAIDERPDVGTLYRLDPDGTVTPTISRVSISNGLGWSADGSTMFYIDTPTRRVDAYEFDLASGELGERRTAVAITRGNPDGLTIDADGAVWVALWGGGAVQRYVDGMLDLEIEIPASNVTSCTFGGPDLTDLFVTTAWYRLDAATRAAEPLAGAVFRVRDAGQGILPHTFGG